MVGVQYLEGEEEFGMSGITFPLLGKASRARAEVCGIVKKTTVDCPIPTF